jgi:hypothetical protein
VGSIVSVDDEEKGKCIVNGAVSSRQNPETFMLYILCFFSKFVPILCWTLLLV